jgi:rod shape-determining protein MreC
LGWVVAIVPEWLWKWRREIIFALLIVTALALLISQRNPNAFSLGLRQMSSFLFVPLQSKTTALVTQLRHLGPELTSLRRVSEDNQTLRHAVERLTLENNLLHERDRENTQLRQDLGYRQHTPYHFIPADVVSRDPASWLERLVINQGSRSGIRVNTGVLVPEGVVGRVMEVHLSSAVIMLLPDQQSSLASAIERSRVPGTVKGIGQTFLSLLHVTTADDIKIGDRVVTSTVSSLFPPGIMIGTIQQVAPTDNGLMLAVHIKPAVDFQRLERVWVLQGSEE